MFNNCKTVPKTTSFYRDLFIAFRRAGGKIDCAVSSFLESGGMPLFKNTCVTSDGSIVESPVLRNAQLHHLKDVVLGGKLLSFQEIANRCNIRNINAGRIASNLNRHIDHSLVVKARQGSPNHICNWLVIDNDNDSIEISKTTAKSNYRNFVRQKFVTSCSQNKWQDLLVEY